MSHFPECNCSATQAPHLCSSNRPHPPLTATLSHCSIVVIQGKTTTLRYRQSTQNFSLGAHTTYSTPNPLDGVPRESSHRRSLEGQLFLAILASMNHFTIRAVALL